MRRDGVGAVAALAAFAGRLGQHAVGLVVADGGGLQAEALGELADGERRGLVHASSRLDFNVG